MTRILLCFTLLFSAFFAQAVDINTITAAFKTGNASTLAAFMDQEVDMAVPASTKKCNPSEAIALLNAFFTSNPPTQFAVVHHAAKKDSGFLVGKLLTAKGEFRVNITYRTENNKDIIQSIRME
ncbi:MAG: DUF4783 domain-containing protein [Tannerellaceae bacterium]|jgi:hypothetical protein|nr:DUF4783 domain-containing protein [Tannerellaceae bacterium]